MEKATSSTPSTESAQSSKPTIPVKFQDAVCILLIFFSLIIFFGKAIYTNNTLQAGDAISFNSFVPFLNAEEKAHEAPLWLPNVFSGMPSFGSLMLTGDRWYDLTTWTYMKIEGVVKTLSSNPDIFRIIFEYWIMGIGIYIYMRSKKAGRMIALFCALALIYSSFVIVFVMIGHNTKVWALMCAPYILLLLDSLLHKFRWLNVALLAVAVHLCIESTHVQMVFNLFFGFGIYLLYQLIVAAIKKENVLPYVKTILAFGVCAGIGAGMAADRYLSVQEYNPYSIRGTGPLQQAATDHATEGGGLDYDYATNWSFSPEEVLTFIVPGYYGTGMVPYPYKGKIVHAGGYWGQMPFTDLPNYMGLIVLLLAIYGCVKNWKNRSVQALAVMSVIALFISFGRNLSFLYDLMFYYFPMFNKFRAPSMILALVQFSLPILAGYGLLTIISRAKSMSEKEKKRILYLAIGCVAWLIIGFIYQSANKDSYITSVEESGKSQLPGEFVYDMATGDWERCAIIAALFFGGAYFFVQGKIKGGVVVAAAIGLTLVDLMWIDARRMDIVPQKDVAAEFQKTDVVDFLQNDNSLHRIYDITDAPNKPAYWLMQHIVGYDAAKMREYQDMLDVAGVGVGVNSDFENAAQRANANSGGPIANAFLWNLLNVKYIVSPVPPGPAFKQVFTSQEERAAVYQNSTMLPRAFFVNHYEVKTPLAILNAMKQGSFDPRNVEYCEIDPKVDVQPPDSTASVTVDSYEPQKIALKANASGNNLLFMSEVYYKPAWKAYVDGVETPILKTDYLFRSIVVPKGSHTIEFRYISSAFETGKMLSLGLNGLVVVIVVVFGVVGYTKRRKTEE